MRHVDLHGLRTTSLGFGGSLLGSTWPNTSRALLRAAYDAGIRHFDVAPMYSFGKSEQLLREALGEVSDITVTTKYGLLPPPHSRWIGPLHRAGGTLLGRFPSLKQRFRKNAAQAQWIRDPPLLAAEAQASIDSSLRQLGRSTIDLLLLHEATPERLVDDGLLEVLERNKAAGKIREYGVGSRSERVEACLGERAAYCRVVQYEWSAFSSFSLKMLDTPRICHGSLGGPRGKFVGWLQNDTTRLDLWSELVGVDLRRTGSIERLLLKASFVKNNGHIVLFSTKSSLRISENVAISLDPALTKPAMALLSLIHERFLPLLIESQDELKSQTNGNISVQDGPLT